jgi:F-type H+-transporting ATPase subunit delta
VKNTLISKRYAKALVLLAQRRQQLEGVADELNRLRQAFAREPRLPLLLASPSLAAGKKSAMLGDVGDYLQLSPLVRNFVRLLQSRDRLVLLGGIVQAFRRQADRAQGIVRARVVSAIPLNDAQRHTLQTQLKARTGRQVLVESHSDAALLGGVRVEIDGQVFDGSVRTQLRRLAGHLRKEP